MGLKMNDLPELLRYLHVEQRYTYVQIAKKLNCSVNALYLYRERGVVPNRQTTSSLKSFCASIGIPPKQFNEIIRATRRANPKNKRGRKVGWRKG